MRGFGNLRDGAPLGAGFYESGGLAVWTYDSPGGMPRHPGARARAERQRIRLRAALSFAKTRVAAPPGPSRKPARSDVRAT